MEEILQLVAKVEQKATAIIELANKEKQELAENQKKENDSFLTQKTKEYENEQHELEVRSKQEVEEQNKKLEEEAEKSAQRLRTYYTSHEGSMVNELVQQITGV